MEFLRKVELNFADWLKQVSRRELPSTGSFSGEMSGSAASKSETGNDYLSCSSPLSSFQSVNSFKVIFTHSYL